VVEAAEVLASRPAGSYPRLVAGLADTVESRSNWS
jgi:hypothetical protein